MPLFKFDAQDVTLNSVFSAYSWMTEVLEGLECAQPQRNHRDSHSFEACLQQPATPARASSEVHTIWQCGITL